MDKRNKKLLKCLQKNNCIDLNTFLMCYCGVWNDVLLVNKVTHSDIKFLFPDLKKVSFDFVLKNLKDVYTGNIILVKDSNNNVVPYINPKLEDIFDIEVNYERYDTNIEEDAFDRVVELEGLSSYELIQLAKKYREKKRMKEYRKVCRLIKAIKEDNIEEFHKKKEKIIMKGRLEYDKY